MELAEIIDRTKEQLAVLSHLAVSGVVGIARSNGDEWHVTVELIERKAIPDAQDLLGVYEAVLDDKGSMISYHRKRVRRRGDMEEEAEG
jgi:hypothetical protein